MKQEKMYCFKVIKEIKHVKTNVYIPIKAFNIIDATEKLKGKLLQVSNHYIDKYKKENGDIFEYELIINRYSELNIIKKGRYSYIDDIVFGLHSFECVGDEMQEKQFMNAKMQLN